MSFGPIEDKDLCKKIMHVEERVDLGEKKLI